MKYVVALLLISTLFSCQSRRAKDFKTMLDSTDRKVFHILIDKNVEDKRLEALIDKKPAIALALGKQQATELREVINEIDGIDVDDLPGAIPLKNSTTSYYRSLLHLKEVDVHEAELMSIMQLSDTANAKKAQEDMLDLARTRVEIHKVLGNHDQMRYRAKAKFEERNGLR